jgi:peptide methionine sulfoxide reductase MsrB
VERQEIKSKASLDNRQAYFALCIYPITKEVEDAMEQMSSVVTQEHYGNQHTANGTYSCARCNAALYSSSAKFDGTHSQPSLHVIDA